MSKKPWEDSRWLQNVRQDLETDPEAWIVPPSTSAEGQSKLAALTGYLEDILSAAGYPAHCPTCGAIR